MNDLIKDLLKYKETEKEEHINNIYNYLSKKINYMCKKVGTANYEDIRQEIFIAIYKSLKKFEINYNILDCIDLEVNKYYKEFLYNYEKELIEYKNQELILEEFILFCNENQLLKYIERICANKVADFYRKNKYVEIVSLNQIINEETEMIDLLPEEQDTETNEVNYKKFLSYKEKVFLGMFIDNGKILTQNDVAEKLGISQQAVSSRFNRIKKKIKICNN